jgi:hypothetical protein
MGIGAFAKNGLRISFPLDINKEQLGHIKSRFLNILNKL